MSDIECRLLSFKTKNEDKSFIIQMFGLDEAGCSYSFIVKSFEPFFYIKVGDIWGITKKNSF